jgi:o-succinylbenzoate synthase
MIAYLKKYELQFKRRAKTSRGVYSSRLVWFILLEENGMTGVGECAPLPGLSSETPEEAKQLLKKVCADPSGFINHPETTQHVSSVHFALETAWLDLQHGGRQILFPSPFCEGKKGIPINGLIWMGETGQMQQQIREKTAAGFRCIKLKIGGMDFEKELEILSGIRKEYDAGQIMLRVDANGAFTPGEAPGKLHQLASFNVHSIEQPIAAGQWQEMAALCKQSPVPVALDEELIGVHGLKEKVNLLDTIRPHYLILKPSLHGGISGCNEWIRLAEERDIGWWVTSYLESDVGLNAIAQWTFRQQAAGYQGLGTGLLFTNNIPSPLEIKGERIWFNPQKRFHFPVTFFPL